MSKLSADCGHSIAHPGAVLRGMETVSQVSSHCTLWFSRSEGLRRALQGTQDARCWAGARPVEGAVLWKTGAPAHPHSQFPTGLGKRPPATHPRFPHLRTGTTTTRLYITDSTTKRSSPRRAGLRPALLPETLHKCNCRRCTSVVDTGHSSLFAR